MLSRDNSISVVIPVYNAEKYIKRCVDSIELQKNQESSMEVILVNDGSTDNSLKACEDLSTVYNNVIVVNQENRGVSAARNTGMKKASMKKILFVDADDMLESDFFDSLIRYPEAELIVNPYKELFESTSSSHIYREEGYGDTPERVGILIGVSNLAYVWGKFFDNEIIRYNDLKFDENLQFGEDNLFTLQYCTFINNCYVSNLGFYDFSRRLGESLSKKYVNNLDLFFKQFDSIQDELYQKYPSYKKIWDSWCPDLALHHSRARIRNIYRISSPYHSSEDKVLYIKKIFETLTTPRSLLYMSHSKFDFVMNILMITNSPKLSNIVLSKLL